MPDQAKSSSTTEGTASQQPENNIWAPGPTPAAQGPVDRIKAGEYLTLNQVLTSKNGEYTLALQSNQSLCIQRTKTGEKTYYYTQPDQTGARFLTVTSNGELRILPHGSLTPIWTSSTGVRVLLDGQSDDWDGVDNQGVFVLRDDGSAETQTKQDTGFGWKSRPWPHGPLPTVSAALALPPGQTMVAGQVLLNAGMKFYLRLEANGLLAVYWKPQEKPTWTSGNALKTTSPAANGGLVTLSLLSNGGPAIYVGSSKTPLWKEDGNGVNVKDGVLTIGFNGEFSVKSGGKEVWRGGKAIRTS